MFDIIRDVAKVGVGALSLSKENLKKLTDELAELGKISREEGDKLFEEFEATRKEQQKNLIETVDNAVRQAVDQMGFAPKTELEILQKRISELEERLKDVPKPEGESEQ